MTVNLCAFGEALPGEDRGFGGNSFYVDMTPASAHFVSLRTCLAIPDWKALSQYVIQRAGRKCEICGSEERLEAHERWRFDAGTQKQDVVRLLCVCKKCHLGIHYSLAGMIGMRKEIDAHIMAITGWDEAMLVAHVKERSKVYSQLSERTYEVDLSLFEKIGIVPRPPAVRTKRVAAAKGYVGLFDNTKEGQVAMERYMEREMEREAQKFDEQRLARMKQPSQRKRKEP